MALFANKDNIAVAVSEVMEGDIGLKKWECVQVSHHNNVGKTIEEIPEQRLEPSHIFCRSAKRPRNQPLLVFHFSIPLFQTLHLLFLMP